jgi:hypothetical protein
MPEKITIDGLVMDDSNPVEKYAGPKLLATFNDAYASEDYKQKFPYVIIREIDLRGLKIKSGKPYIISNNPFMFRNVRITEKP